MKEKICILFVTIASIFTPLVPLSLTIGILIVADFVVGIYRAIKNGDKITSRKMSNTISKMLLYQIMILSLFLLEKFIFDGILPITKLAAGFISIIEIKSISENIEMITGFNIWDKLMDALKRGQSTTKDLIEGDK